MADNILNKSLSTKNTLNKLVDTSKVIERRKGVKEVEGKHVNEAFRLLTHGRPVNARGVKQQAVYLDFLKRV